jgi:hypothetical protein
MTIRRRSQRTKTCPRRSLKMSLTTTAMAHSTILASGQLWLEGALSQRGFGSVDEDRVTSQTISRLQTFFETPSGQTTVKFRPGQNQYAWRYHRTAHAQPWRESPCVCIDATTERTDAHLGRTLTPFSMRLRKEIISGRLAVEKSKYFRLETEIASDRQVRGVSSKRG